MCVGVSACALLACCCTPMLGACILSWANVPPSRDFSINQPTLQGPQACLWGWGCLPVPCYPAGMLLHPHVRCMHTVMGQRPVSPLLPVIKSTHIPPGPQGP